MSMFNFPFGFYTAHFLYLFRRHLWVTFLSTELNLSLLQILWYVGWCLPMIEELMAFHLL